MIINTYTGGFSGTVIKNALNHAIDREKIITFDEIGLRQKNSEEFLPCGMTTICEFNQKKREIMQIYIFTKRKKYYIIYVIV